MPATERAARPRWLTFYVALAAINVATVLASQLLGVRLMRLHGESVRVAREWSDRSDRYAQLATQAAEVDAPGNDVFISHDVAGESRRLDTAYARFGAQLSAARQDLARHVPAPERARLAPALDDAGRDMDAMVAAARDALAHLRAGRLANGAERMAVMDHHFARLTRRLRDMRTEVAAIQDGFFAEQLRLAGAARRYEYVVAVGVALMVLAIVYYGWRLSRLAAAAADRQARSMEALRQSEERYRQLSEELEHRVEARTADLVEAQRGRAAQSAFLRQVIDTIPNFVFVKDRQGRFTLANQAVADAYGTTAEAMIGRSDADLNPNADEVERFRDDDRRVMDSREEVVIPEERITDARGEERWLQTVKRPIVGADGQVDQMLGVSTDITARKHTKMGLARLAAIIESSAYAIVSTDLAGVITTWNPGAERLFGYTAAEAIGQPVMRLLAPHEADRVVERIDWLRKNGTLEEMEVRRRCRDGRMADVAMSLSVIDDPEGEPLGFVGIYHDIGERKRAEARLRESEAQLVEAQRLARVGSWRQDLVSGATTWSAETYRQLGYDPRTVEPSFERFVAAIHPDDRDRVLATIAHARAHGGDMVYEARVRGLDGAYRTGEMHGHVVRDAAGRPVAIFGTLRDVTEQREVEATLRAARAAAEEASRAKSEFLANMSHEIRTPMNGVLGMVELVLDSELSPEQRDHLETARSSAESLLDIINDILDFSKIEAGRLELAPVPFRLGDGIADAIGPLALRAREKGLELALEITPETPDALVGDFGRLRQVIVNLVGNAIKFTHGGEIVLRIEPWERSASETLLHVTVRDTGIGIPPEKQRAVFEAFQQADTSTTRHFGGTGLGLAISSRLVALMGGRIWVESAAGAGSTFHFTARFEVASAGDAETPPPATDPRGAPALVVDDRATSLRVLVAEDNPVNQKLARSLLERAGHEVRVVADGRQAVDATARERFDVVLMDVQMPEMGGLEATRLIRERERQAGGGHLPIVAVTARAMQGDREMCLAAGMDDYVSKPIRSEQILGAIEALVPRAAPPASPARSVAAAADAADDVFDEPALLAIAHGDRELLGELARLFVDDLPARLAAIHAALDEGDAGRVERAAHAIKGAAASLVARRAAASARRLEELGRSGDLAAAADAAAALEAELSLVRGRLAPLLDPRRPERSDERTSMEER